MFNFLKRAVMGGNAGADGDAQASAGSQEATPYTTTKIGQLRYKVEHEFFRDFFYKNGTGLIDALLEPHGMGNVYCTALKEMRAHPKYYDDEFGLESMKTDLGNYMVSCRLPKPEHIGLCHRMHFIFNSDFSQLAYYTIERTAEGGELCMWDAQGNHKVIHAIEQPDWKQTENPVAAMKAELEEIVALFDPNDGLTGGGQAAEEEPAEEQAAEEQGAEEPLAADEQSVDEQPADEQPAEEQPADEQPAEEPLAEQPSEPAPEKE